MVYRKTLWPVGWMAAVAVQTELHLLGPFVLILTDTHSECVFENKEVLLFGSNMEVGEGLGALLM